MLKLVFRLSSGNSNNEVKRRVGVKKILEKASAVIDSHEDHIRKHIHHEDSAVSFYGNSIHKEGRAVISMARDHINRFIMVFSARKSGVISKFSGELLGDSGIFAKKCPLNDANASLLRKLFPWTAPVSLRNCKTTIGCGDRLGMASPGHIAAVREFKASPVLAQQSMRELKFTGKTFHEVIDDVTFQVFQSGFKDGYGADGDHLKTLSDINIALAAGMPMITLDLSEEMCSEAGNWDDSEILAAFDSLPSRITDYIENTYFDRMFQAGKYTFEMDAQTARRCTVMYYKAMDFAAKVNEHLKANRGDDFDLEISLDEVSSPTLPEHHFFIANELETRKVGFCSLAPRFVGDFLKGLDYIGDLKEFEEQFTAHAEIAKAFGDYKLSLHTGSDKFKIYPIIGKLTKNRVHIKTAGTSWLKALELIAEKDPVLFRVIHSCVMDHLNETGKYYPIVDNLKKSPLDSVYDEDLPVLFKNEDFRQLLHVSYGPVISDHAIRPMLFSILHNLEEDYHEKLKLHFEKHLKTLNVSKK
jgi:hypothetical protein